MQVDLRVLEELGFPVRCAVTALTVQGDQGVLRIDPADPSAVELAILTALNDEPGIAGVKIGLVPGPEIVRSVASALSEAAPGTPVVVDPVMRSTSGTIMAGDEVAQAILDHIAPLAAILTPNENELEVLSRAAGIDSKDPCEDLLFMAGVDEPVRFTHPRIAGKTPRGTGCALSTALTAYLADSLALEDAVGRAIEYVVGKIERSVVIGKQRMLFSGG
jgi:hydroxymethylpyrimidine/phosphomethylpyrimidine kinase